MALPSYQSGCKASQTSFQPLLVAQILSAGLGSSALNHNLATQCALFMCFSRAAERFPFYLTEKTRREVTAGESMQSNQYFCATGIMAVDYGSYVCHVYHSFIVFCSIIHCHVRPIYPSTKSPNKMTRTSVSEDLTFILPEEICLT